MKKSEHNEKLYILIITVDYFYHIMQINNLKVIQNDLY